MFSSDILKHYFAIFLLCLLCLLFPLVWTILTISGCIELFLRRKKFKSICGEVAVVTGAGHGLGRCIAIELASRGCQIAVVDINFEGAEETVQFIKSQYEVKCKAYKVDVTDFELVTKLNKEITNDLGLATILINNAGVLTFSNYARPKFEEIQRMINVNLVAHFVTIGVFLENMKTRGKGHVVAICSILGLFPLLYNSAYCATKFAVRGMMRSLRLDLMVDHFNEIHTTTVYPSFLSTNNDIAYYAEQCCLNKFYPLIKGEYAARSIVNAMLRNEVEISLPRGFAVLSRIFDFFPAKYQDVLWRLTTKPFIDRFKNVYKEHRERSE